MADNDDFFREFQAEGQMAKRSRRRLAIGSSVLLMVMIPILSVVVAGALKQSERVESPSNEGASAKVYQYSYLGKKCRTGLENHQQHVKDTIVASRQADLIFAYPLYVQVPENITLHTETIAHNDKIVRQGKENIKLLEECIAKVKDKKDFTRSDVVNIKDTITTLPSYRTIEFGDAPESVGAEIDSFSNSFNFDDFMASDDFDYSSLSWTDDYGGFEYEGVESSYDSPSYDTSSTVKECNEGLRQQYQNEYESQQRQLGTNRDRETRAASESAGSSGGLGSQYVRDVSDRYTREADRLLRDYERRLRGINC